MNEQFNISNGFFDTAAKTPDALAIQCDGQSITYGQLANKALRVAKKLQPALKKKRVGIVGSRSIFAYVGILGAAASGATYVPINLKWPEERLIAIFGQLELDAIIVDKNGSKLITENLRPHAPDLIICCDEASPIENAIRFQDLPDHEQGSPIQSRPDDLGYIIFTSGTTGMPKGVMISQKSLEIYLDEAQTWCDLNGKDRIAEAHDLTFDLSVHNMFLAWRGGSALYIMSALDMMAPHAFIRKHDITVWLTVPTIVNNVRRANRLSPNLFPTLRLSIFCGEPLPIATVNAMIEAAPNAVIENIYGPTECTIVCSRQRITNRPAITPDRDIIAIGTEFSNTEMLIVGSDFKALPDGEVGEFALVSPKLAVGYLDAPEQTEKAFKQIDGKRIYLTGDLGYRGEDGLLHYMGRIDNQVKMKGNRIELEEVDTHLRRAAKTELAAIVAWPILEGIPQGLIGFTIENGVTPEDIKASMKASLPQYMLPAKIIQLAEMPRNPSDKIDRKALFAMLEKPAKVTAA